MHNSLAIISLELGVAVLFWLVFVVLETAVLQFLQWDTFKGCLRASLIANLASGIIVALSFIKIPQAGFPGLFLGILLVMVIEGLVLSRLKPSDRWVAWKASLAVNVVSFIILMLPIFLITVRQ